MGTRAVGAGSLACFMVPMGFDFLMAQLTEKGISRVVVVMQLSLDM